MEALKVGVLIFFSTLENKTSAWGIEVLESERETGEIPIAGEPQRAELEIRYCHASNPHSASSTVTSTVIAAQSYFVTAL
ncbi:MAG: hypothetical protein ACBR50_03705 [Microcoleus sp.]